MTKCPKMTIDEIKQEIVTLESKSEVPPLSEKKRTNRIKYLRMALEEKKDDDNISVASMTSSTSSIKPFVSFDTSNKVLDENNESSYVAFYDNEEPISNEVLSNEVSNTCILQDNPITDQFKGPPILSKSRLIEGIKKFEFIISCDPEDMSRASNDEIIDRHKLLKKQVEGLLKNTSLMLTNVYISGMSKIADMSNPALVEQGIRINDMRKHMNEYKENILECVRTEFGNSPEYLKWASKLSAGFAGIAMFTGMALTNAIEFIPEKKASVLP